MERLFFGIIPKPAIVSQLAEKCQLGVEAFPSSIKWFNPEDMYILLKDIGSFDESKKNLLTSCAFQLRSHSFPVQLSPMKLHPTYSKNGSFRTIQCNITCQGNHFRQLLDEIDRFVALCNEQGTVDNVETNNAISNFRPRILIGRNASNITRRIFKPWLQANNFQEPTPFVIDECYLICRKQIENGSMTYEILRTYPLTVQGEANINNSQSLYESTEIETKVAYNSTTCFTHNNQNIETSNSTTIIQTITTVTRTTVVEDATIVDNNYEASSSKERIFIGIKLPADAVQSLQNLYKPHQPSLPHVKWEKDDNLHITLRFIGDLSNLKRQELQERLFHCFSQNTLLTHFPAQLSKYSIFPKKGEFRILHCIVEETEEAFPKLKQAVDACVTACGISIDDNIDFFIPHVTLARNRKAKRSNVLSWIQAQQEETEANTATFPIDFSVTEVQLFRSHLSSEGAIYEILQSYSLSLPNI